MGCPVTAQPVLPRHGPSFPALAACHTLLMNVFSPPAPEVEEPVMSRLSGCPGLRARRRRTAFAPRDAQRPAREAAVQSASRTTVRKEEGVWSLGRAQSNSRPSVSGSGIATRSVTTRKAVMKSTVLEKPVARASRKPTTEGANVVAASWAAVAHE